MKTCNKKFQQKVKKLIKKYMKLLDLEKWHIDIISSKSNMLSYHRGKVSSSEVDYFAEVIYNYLSRYATITFTKMQTVDNLEELENTIYHELLHIKMSPLIQVVEALVTVSGLKRKKAMELLIKIDVAEHELIETIIKLTLAKKRDK